MPFSKESAFDRLRDAHRSGRLAHAYLLSGPAGCGKSWLATRLAALVLGCEAERAFLHPDAHVVQPESKSRRILTDQIRRLEQALQRKPLVGKSKIAILHDADRLQPNAANAFLKTLEEPPPGTFILLLSTLPEAMLDTVLSRCVETPLRPEANRAVSPEARALLEALGDCLASPAAPGVADAFRFTRAVQGILSGMRERIGGEFESALKQETARYKQSTDGDQWLTERAEQVKALTESSVLRERDQLLQTVGETLGDALRVHHGGTARDALAGALARKFPAPALLSRLDALETLRRRLAAGVQEALALESGFLELVCAPGKS